MARGNQQKSGVGHPILMLALISAVVLSPLLLCGQVRQKRAKRFLAHERDVETAITWRRFPVWRAGMLVGYHGEDVPAPLVYTVDRDGRRDEFLFTLQDAARITIAQATASETGEIALVGYAVTDDLRGSLFLARIAPDRKSQIVTRTWPYAPTAVTFAPDGTIWTIGHVFDRDRSHDLAYHVLRRFDGSGRVLSTKVIRVRGEKSDSASYLNAFRDRVGYFTVAGEYLEFSLDGSEIARYDGPDGAVDQPFSVFKDVTIAVTDEGDVIVANSSKGMPDFFMLDREARTWLPVPVNQGNAGKWARLLGSDGLTLVMTSNNGRLSRFRAEKTQ